MTAGRMRVTAGSRLRKVILDFERQKESRHPSEG